MNSLDEARNTASKILKLKHESRNRVTYMHLLGCGTLKNVIFLHVCTYVSDLS